MNFGHPSSNLYSGYNQNCAPTGQYVGHYMAEEMMSVSGGSYEHLPHHHVQSSAQSSHNNSRFHHTINNNDAPLTNESQPSIMDILPPSNPSCDSTREQVTWSTIPSLILQKCKSIFPKYQSYPKDCETRVSSVLEAWKLFFPDSLLDEIVEYTNDFIMKIRAKYNRERDAQDTTRSELEALFGLLYLLGSAQHSKLNVDKMWMKEGIAGDSRLQTCMSMKRFRFLLNNVCFGPSDAANCSDDNLKPIRMILTSFVEKCKRSYYPKETMLVQELLIPFRGDCPVRQYFNYKFKPGKCGVKMYALIDSKSRYVYNLEINGGKQPEGPYFDLEYNPVAIAKRLLSPISGSGRLVAVEKQATSVAMVTELLHHHNIRVIGALRNTDKDLPVGFGKMQHKKSNPAMFAYSDKCTLISYLPENAENPTIILSTAESSDKLDSITLVPQIVSTYNSTMEEGEKMKGMISEFTVARKSWRWPLTIFYSLLDIAAANSCIIYNRNQPVTNEVMRQFLENLCNDLTSEYVKERATKLSLPVQLKLKLSQVSGVPMKRRILLSERVGKSARCLLCPFAQRKTTVACVVCQNYICSEHTIVICVKCLNEENRHLVRANDLEDVNTCKSQCEYCPISNGKSSTSVVCSICSKYICKKHKSVICAKCHPDCAKYSAISSESSESTKFAKSLHLSSDKSTTSNELKNFEKRSLKKTSRKIKLRSDVSRNCESLEDAAIVSTDDDR